MQPAAEMVMLLFTVIAGGRGGVVVVSRSEQGGALPVLPTTRQNLAPDPSLTE